MSLCVNININNGEALNYDNLLTSRCELRTIRRGLLLRVRGFRTSRMLRSRTRTVVHRVQLLQS